MLNTKPGLAGGWWPIWTVACDTARRNKERIYGGYGCLTTIHCCRADQDGGRCSRTPPLVCAREGRIHACGFGLYMHKGSLKSKHAKKRASMKQVTSLPSGERD